mmetsp:Transcript_8005/g.12848  ORF Transcript_8005/g.12848 Transcript_8005/m.12848 type:complete len:255 (+) Transcript_8005:3787-4551(+)
MARLSLALERLSVLRLAEAGAQWGKPTALRNPRMTSYILGERLGHHVIDLDQTLVLLRRAANVMSEIIAAGGSSIFIGKARESTSPIKEAALGCEQHYVDVRWRAGLLTNWSTVSLSLRSLQTLERQLKSTDTDLMKKERSMLARKKEKLDRIFGGLRDMSNLPDVLFVLDTIANRVAINEATKCNIPVIAIVDTDCSSEGITYPIPGSSSAPEAVKLYCDVMKEAALAGLAARGKGRVQAPSEPRLRTLAAAG